MQHSDWSIVVTLESFFLCCRVCQLSAIGVPLPTLSNLTFFRGFQGVIGPVVVADSSAH